MTIRQLRRILPSAVTAMLSVAATAAFADNLRMIAPLTGNVSVPVVSMKEARFVGTLHQQYDFSCGSAAVATLLTHHYGHKVTEAEVFQVMFEHGNRDKIRAIYDERFCRMWEFYLVGCELSFRHLGQMVFQMQLSRRLDTVPLTRNYITEFERHHAGRAMSAA